MKPTRIASWGSWNARWVAVVLIICILGANALKFDSVADKPKKCTYQKAYRMYGAFCSGLSLQSVPHMLKTNIEILDLSVNRIRDLRNDTFVGYSGIRFLYLSDNVIHKIESNAFEPLSSLEVLDLTLNVLTTIPSFILNLPSLRKLYVAENELYHLNDDLKNLAKPIAAPLQYLNLAMCDLREFPDFGILPDLIHLNVSDNKFKSLSPRDFTNLCALETLDLSDSYKNDDVCLIKPLAMWFVEKKIETIPETYSMYNPHEQAKKQCAEVALNEEDEITYLECRNLMQVKEQVKAQKKTWLIIGSCLGGILLVGVCFLCMVHRRNLRQAKLLDLQNENNEKFIT